MSSKGTTKSHSSGLTSAALEGDEQQSKLELLLHPPTVGRRTRGWLWANLLFAALMLAFSELSLPLLASSALLLGTQVLWGIAISRDPKRYARGFYLHLAYAGAVGSLTWLVMALDLTSGGWITVAAVYSLGLVGMWFLAGAWANDPTITAESSIRQIQREEIRWLGRESTTIGPGRPDGRTERMCLE